MHRTNVPCFVGSADGGKRTVFHAFFVPKNKKRKEKKLGGVTTTLPLVFHVPRTKNFSKFDFFNSSKYNKKS